MITLSDNATSGLFNLITSVDFKTSDIIIAEHEIEGGFLLIWLEDKNDFKSTLYECLLIAIELSEFADFIRAGKYNSYRGQKLHKKGGFVYDTDIVISTPLHYYNSDCTSYEANNIREALVQSIIKQLLSNVKG